jgi:hypothetical protein
MNEDVADKPTGSSPTPQRVRAVSSLKNLSPTSLEVFPEPLKMDFPEAMRVVSKGAKVTKLEWGDPTIYVMLHDSHLSLHKSDGRFFDLIVSAGDMLGTDWIFVP